MEILASIGVMAAIIAGVTRLANDYMDDTKTALAAQQMVTVGNAAQAYIKDNYTAVMGNATATTPALITIPMLTAAGYLQAGFQTTNNYGQSVCVVVLEPTANNLNALVVAEGGTTIDDLTLGGLALAIGASGGGVYSTATTTLRGSMGGWSTPVGNFANTNNLNQRCDGTAGAPVIAAGRPVMALWFSNGDATSGFVYRDAVPGRPELNTMNAPLVMNSVQTANGACTTTGAIARDASGGILACKGGNWTAPGSAYWNDPVANYASLPVTGNSLGAVRMARDTGRAFMWTGGAWSALAVDQNGDLTVPGTLTAAGGRVVAWNQASGGVVQLVGANGSNMFLQSDNGTFRLVNSAWSNTVFTVDQSGNVTNSGTLTSGGRMTTNEYLKINGAATVGSACTPNGLLGMETATSKLLACQGGLWANAQGGTGLSGLLAPYQGKTVSCAAIYQGNNYTFSATVDTNGYPYVRIRRTFGGSDTGWVAGRSVYLGTGVGGIWATLDVYGVAATDPGANVLCSAAWPLT